MEVERNQLGHYQFSDEDIALLRKIQDQLNEGIILQKVSISEKKIRKATVQKHSETNKEHEQLIERVVRLENGLKTKADDVVSYQLYSTEGNEEMHKLVKKLEARIEALETPTGQHFDYFSRLKKLLPRKRRKGHS
jgi:chromosome-anchoring protein RacA